MNVLILNQKHKPRFEVALIAAIRGIKFVPKKAILELDIAKLCDDIAEFVKSESNSSRARFSLRLSAFLINGTMRIYQQKVMFLVDNIGQILVRRPHFSNINLAICDTPSTTIAKKKGKKRPHAVKITTPENALVKLVAKIQEIEPLNLPELEYNIPRARNDDVTIRETQRLAEEDLTDDEFGNFGTFDPDKASCSARELFSPLSDIEDIVPKKISRWQPLAFDEPIKEISLQFSEKPIPEKVCQPQPLVFEEPIKEISLHFLKDTATGKVSQVQPLIIVEPAKEISFPNLEDVIPPKTRRLIRSASFSSESDTDCTRLRVQDEIHDSSTCEVQRKLQQREQKIRERLALREIQLRSLKKRKLVTEKMKKKKKKQSKNAFAIHLSKRAYKYAKIDRPQQIQKKKNDNWPQPLFEVKMKCLNITNLLEMYAIKEENTPETVRERSEEMTLRKSPPLQRRIQRESLPIEISRPKGVVPTILEEQVKKMSIHEIPQLPTESDLAVPMLLPVATGSPRLEIEMAAAAKEQFVSPQKRSRLIDSLVLTGKEPVQPVITEEEPVQPVITEEEPVEPVITEEDRQENILKLVSTGRRLTLEEVCEKPINKLNIARAFSDLLGLCKSGYVTLISEEDSLELKFIEKGPKMNR